MGEEKTKIAEETDHELVLRCQGGTEEEKREAFHGLYQRHAGPLCAFLAGITHCSHRAEDLTQEAFCRFLDHGQQFSGKSSFRTWLYAVAVNLHRDFVRKEAVAMSHQAQIRLHKAPEPSSDPPEVLREEIERLKVALEALPDELRDPVVLVRLEGMKYAEAAEVLGISIEALRMRIHRGHLALAEALR